MFLVKNGGHVTGQCHILNDGSEGSFMELQKINVTKYNYGAPLAPAMSGIVSSGKLSSTGNEIRVAWEMVMGTS